MIEVTTPSGLAYVHYSHHHDLFGSLVRVLPGVFDVALTAGQIEDLVHQRERFFAFCPLAQALKGEVMRVVASHPSDDIPFPLFRAAGFRDPESGRVKSWFLWDGKETRRIQELSDEQRQLPLREIVNDTLLIERIVEGWTPAAAP